MGTPIENNTTELQAILEAAEMLPSEAVLYAEQTLTDAQKAQARENIGALGASGGTMTGVLTAQNNTSYTTKQVRNIFLIADGETLPSGANGDICLVYTP